MGTHYKVFIFDDHLGLLNGRTGVQEAALIQEELTLRQANTFEPFEYIPQADGIIGELRKDHPSNYMDIWSEYDNVYYSDDSRGSKLFPIK